MLYGHDVIFSCLEAPEFILEEMFRIVRSVWPMAVIENANTGELIDAKTFDFLKDNIYLGIKEVMIYKSSTYLESLNKNGPMHENVNTMIHISIRCVEVTLVVDDLLDCDTSKIIELVRSSRTGDYDAEV